MLIRIIIQCFIILYINAAKLPQRQLSEFITEINYVYSLKHIIPARIGSPEQSLELKLSTAICGIWVFNKMRFNRGFNPTQSGTAESAQYYTKIDNVKGVIVTDDVRFSSYKAIKVPFLLANEVKNEISEVDYDGLIGFGYRCQSKSIGNVNLIQRFLALEREKRKLFYYTIKQKERSGTFGIGSFPKEFREDDKRFRVSDVIKEKGEGNWRVKFNAIFLDDSAMMIRAPDNVLSIGIGGSLFSVTQDVFYYIKSRKFNRQIDIGNCYTKNLDDMEQIFCKENFDTSKMGIIGIIIGKWSFKINISNMFYSAEDDGKKVKWLSLIYNKTYNKFYLSQNLIYNSTLVFDYEHERVGLYVENNK